MPKIKVKGQTVQTGERPETNGRTHTHTHGRYQTYYLPCSVVDNNNKKHLKNVGPIRHCEPPHAHSPGVATVARAHSMSTTTTTTTRDRGDRYGPIEWAQSAMTERQSHRTVGNNVTSRYVASTCVTIASVNGDGSEAYSLLFVVNQQLQSHTSSYCRLESSATSV